MDTGGAPAVVAATPTDAVENPALGTDGAADDGIDAVGLTPGALTRAAVGVAVKTGVTTRAVAAAGVGAIAGVTTRAGVAVATGAGAAGAISPALCLGR